MKVNTQASTHALHTDRINLSPFTKDFRVWGALNENRLISLRLPSGSFLTLDPELSLQMVLRQRPPLQSTLFVV